MFKKIVKSTLTELGDKLGLYIRIKKDIPFGVNWINDIEAYFKASQNKINMVFDVGANIGQTALLMHQYHPNALIYSFEPIPTSQSELIKNTQKISEITVVASALGEEIGEFYMTNKPLSGTNKIVATKEATNIDVISVRVDTIDNFCLVNKIDKIDILKIDVEGFEIPVLKGAQQMLQNSKIGFVYAECVFKDNDDGHTNFWEIFNYLKPFKYQLLSLYTQSVNHSGFCVGNALFIKNSQDNPSYIACTSPYQKFTLRQFS